MKYPTNTRGSLKMNTITWDQMTAAGLDLDRVHLADVGTPDAWVAYDAKWRPDAELRVEFGTSSDVEHVVPEGEHPGWSACGYERDEDGQWFATQEAYFEPADVEGLLNFVRRWSE